MRPHGRPQAAAAHRHLRACRGGGPHAHALLPPRDGGQSAGLPAGHAVSHAPRHQCLPQQEVLSPPPPPTFPEKMRLHKQFMCKYVCGCMCTHPPPPPPPLPLFPCSRIPPVHKPDARWSPHSHPRRHSFYQGKVRSGVSPDQRPPLRGIPWASKYPGTQQSPRPVHVPSPCLPTTPGCQGIGSHCTVTTLWVHHSLFCPTRRKTIITHMLRNLGQ